MRTNLKRSYVICLLPERERFGKATQQLIVDTEVFCRELGFSTKTIRSLISFISNLVFSRYKLYIVLYPGTTRCKYSYLSRCDAYCVNAIYYCCSRILPAYHKVKAY